MIKSKIPRPDFNQPLTTEPQRLASVSPAVGSSNSSAEIKLLNNKIVKMQGEIDSLKKQLNQVVSFIKQKIK